jgi:hypothetical protein
VKVLVISFLLHSCCFLSLWGQIFLRHRWEDNIKMDLREIGIHGMNWIPAGSG